MRSGAVHYAGKLSYREDIERYFAKHPTATIDQVRAATGAPLATVTVVARRLREAGRLPPRITGSVWRAL